MLLKEGGCSHPASLHHGKPQHPPNLNCRHWGGSPEKLGKGLGPALGQHMEQGGLGEAVQPHQLSPCWGAGRMLRSRRGAEEEEGCWGGVGGMLGSRRDAGEEEEGCWGAGEKLGQLSPCWGGNNLLVFHQYSRNSNPKSPNFWQTRQDFIIFWMKIKASDRSRGLCYWGFVLKVCWEPIQAPDLAGRGKEQGLPGLYRAALTARGEKEMLSTSRELKSPADTAAGSVLSPHALGNGSPMAQEDAWGMARGKTPGSGCAAPTLLQRSRQSPCWRELECPTCSVASVMPPR